jgi:hypothetical protein
MNENAMEFVAIGGSFLDKVDVVDFASGITFSETRLAEDSANAAILDIGEYPGNAEGRLVGLELVGLELDFFLRGRVALGRSDRRLVCGHDSVGEVDRISRRDLVSIFCENREKIQHSNNE